MTDVTDDVCSTIGTQCRFVCLKKNLNASRLSEHPTVRGKCSNSLFQTFFFFPLQQTTSGIGHRVKYFFRVGNQYAECKKQQQVTTNVLIFSPLTGACSEGLDAFIFFFKQQLLKLPELPDVLVYSLNASEPFEHSRCPQGCAETFGWETLIGGFIRKLHIIV